MGTTTSKALRWPTPTVGVKPNVAQDIRNLAEDVDAALGFSANMNGGDWNTVTNAGSYYGSTMANSPDGTTLSFGVLVIRRGATDTGQIAMRLDAPSGATYTRVQKSGTWTPWVQLVDSSNLAALTGDTGWLLSPIAAASGWGTKTDPDGNTSGPITGGARRVGQFIEYRFRVTRTGGTLTADSSGNLADTTIATVSPNAWPNLVPTTALYDNFFVVGVRQGSIRFDQTGTFQITDLYPADTISTGDIVQVSLRFLAG